MRISGTFPEFQLPNLQELTMGQSVLSGTIPSSLQYSANLRGVELAYNKLSGSLPLMTDDNRLLRIDSNHFSGTLSSQLLGSVYWLIGIPLTLTLTLTLTIHSHSHST